MLFGGANGEQGRMNDVYIIDLPTMVHWIPIKLFFIFKETLKPLKRCVAKCRASVWFTWTTHLQEYFAIT